MPTVLEFFDEIAKPTAQNSSSCGAAKEPSQAAWDQVVQAATRLGASGSVSRRRDTGLATQEPAQDIA
jgi:hypothetical protein